MNENTNTAEILTELVHRLRPEWDRPGILAAIENVAARGRHPLDVAMAAIRLAGTPEARTPGALTQLDGPHWRERVTTATAPRPPKPDQACHTCGRHLDACICGEHTTRPPAADRVPPTETYTAAREAIRALMPKTEEPT